MKKTVLCLLTVFAFAISQAQEKGKPVTKPKVQKTDDQWKKELTPEQYEVLRKKGTERPFTGEYLNTFEKGKYICAACGNVLFVSDSKYKSDCGWPSFDRAIKGSVTYQADKSWGMSRTEVNCAGCGGHLGHVFEDGPQETTGMRYCTNSVSIKFVPEKGTKKTEVRK